MASPFVRTDASGRILDVRDHEAKDGTVAIWSTENILRSEAAKGPSTVADEPTRPIMPGGSVSGVIDAQGDTDVVTISLTAGKTYLFSLRGTGPNPINDSLLLLADSAGKVFALDDDGGNDLYSIITYTATTDQNILVAARSFPNEGDPGLGGYTLDVRVQGADAVGDTNAGAATLSQGTTFGFRETGTGGAPIDPLLAGDVDRYAVNLTAGQFYNFKVAGGADYETNPGDVPVGELDTVLILRDAGGNIIALNDDNAFPSDISSGIGFLAETTGTYYLDVTAYAGQTGGYAVEFKQVDLSTLDPLDAIDWESANNVPFVDVGGTPTAYVYFANAGESFGELADDGVAPLPSFGWNTYEKQQVMSALGEFEKIMGVNYEVTTDVTKATFRLITTESEQYGAYFYPQDPAYGDAQGIGAFNVLSGGWSLPGQASLQRGGFAYAVILHEFGHAHGLAHPHDRGGGSEIMPGVTGASSLGVFDLNQGVYSVMSYNDAWQTHPDGPSPYTRATIGQGWSATLSAFDIAVLQERYGVHDYATGNDTYTLRGENATGTYYETIWDSAGVDAIRYDGDKDAQIDLLAATLDYTPTGGGVVSFVDDVFGGFTIANGVVIENAFGGSGDDALLGNSAANLLSGGGGDDQLFGREGADVLLGGLGNDAIRGGDGLDVVTLGGGNDRFLAEITATKSNVAKDAMSIDVITDFGLSGKDVIDLSGFGVTWDFNGTAANKRAGDLTFKRYGNVNAAERVLGLDIDGLEGIGSAGGPVTVVYGNTDGGAADFAIVLLNRSGVTAADFLLTPQAPQTSNAAMFAAMQQESFANYAAFKADYFTV